MRVERAYNCGLEAAFDVVGGKWKGIILWHLKPGPKRFGELKRAVKGITEKMLIQQLRTLESDGIVARRIFAEVPPKVEYSLTELGYSLVKALAPLCDWGKKHAERIETARRVE